MTRVYTLLTVAAVVLAMSSCSSSRNAQNTDDIYYSDGTKKAVASNGSNQGDYYSTAPSDNYVRMKSEDYDRWSTFDDYNSADAYYAPTAAYGVYPSVGFGYGLGYGYGLGLGYGMGFYDPYFAWNSYFMWNSWYNPYFYNPFYGGAVFVVEKGVYGSGAAYATNLRPFNVMSYRNGVNVKSGTSSGTFYRQGMAGTSAYNAGLNSSGRQVNSYRANTNGNNFRSYTPASSSFGSGGGFRASGGGFRAGGGGFRH